MLSLGERCEPQRIEGKVSYVSTTGAFAVVDGWHVPCAEILGVHARHYSQKAA